MTAPTNIQYRPLRLRRSLGAHKGNPEPLSRAASLAVTAAALAVAGLVLAALAFQLAGGRWFIVATPSMGQAAPVGTLVLTVPAHVPDLVAGDVVSFHPPSAPDETYTHRISHISEQGAITTKGDINGAEDPWTLSEQDLIGRATVLLPAAGWIVKALPYLLVGTAALWILTRLYSDTIWRPALRLAGVPLVFAITAFILHPFVGLAVLATGTENPATAPGDGSGAYATVVSTGIFPIRVQASNGAHADLSTGMVGSLAVPAPTDTGHYSLSSELHLTVWQWGILVFLCALPLLWTVMIGLPPAPQKPTTEPSDADAVP